jgi:urea carboxylase
MTNAVRESRIKGVTEICPANASYQIRFDPDLISPNDMLAELKRLESAAGKSDRTLSTRIIEVPVYYNDPWTHETLMRFRERHQDPTGTDLEYAARINGYTGVPDFIQAHSGAPWFVSMVGFVAGLPFMYKWSSGRSRSRSQNTYGRGPTRQSSPSATADVSSASIPFAGPAGISTPTPAPRESL